MTGAYDISTTSEIGWLGRGRTYTVLINSEANCRLFDEPTEFCHPPHGRGGPRSVATRSDQCTDKQNFALAAKATSIDAGHTRRLRNDQTLMRHLVDKAGFEPAT